MNSCGCLSCRKEQERKTLVRFNEIISSSYDDEEYNDLVRYADLGAYLLPSESVVERVSGYTRSWSESRYWHLPPAPYDWHEDWEWEDRRFEDE